jgi:hypothetical protein
MALGYVGHWIDAFGDGALAGLAIFRTLPMMIK